MTARQILVSGARGQLGTELLRHRWPDGWEAIGFDRMMLDLRDPVAIMAAVKERRWSAVVNAAAYTAVDKAESDAVAAWAINALAPAAFAQACAMENIPIIQVSTDYVFAGDRSGCWAVNDPVGPRNVYGASKLGGEMAVRTGCRRHAIVRTSWVVSPHGGNFVKTMLRLASQGSALRVVDDQHGAPTAAKDLAQAIATIAMAMADDEDIAGTYHFSNLGPISWAGFAREIFAQSAARGGPSASVEPIRTTEYPTPAYRPANSVMALDAIARDFNIHPRPWQTALSDILDDLIGVAK